LVVMSSFFGQHRFFFPGQRIYFIEFDDHDNFELCRWLVSMIRLNIGLLILFNSVLPTIKAVRRSVIARSAPKLAVHRLCVHCGYDLRATPDRCPECGNMPRIVQFKTDPLLEFSWPR
jgi:hypothetical protein